MVTTAQEAGLGNKQKVALPNATIREQNLNVNAETFGGGSANQYNAIAEGLGNVGLSMEKIQKERDILDATNLDTEYQKQVRGMLYDPDSGYLSKQSGNAIGVSKDAEKKLEELKRSMLERTESQGARDLFTKSANRIQENTLESLNRFELSQQQKYRDDTFSARSINNAERAALFYNSDAEFEKSLRDNNSVVVAKAAAEGAGPDKLVAMQREANSKLYAARAASMLESDDPETVIKGAEFFEKARSEGNITFEHWQKLDGVAQAGAAKAYSKREFDKLRGGNVGVGDVDSEELFNGMIQQESDGRQFDPLTGAPMESSAGAIGIAQVMPATAPEAAKMAGLEWDETKYRTDKDYNLKIGKAYYNHLVQRYEDPNLAAIAYNWGMGNLDDHIKKVGDPRMGQIPLGNFIASIPSKEAREYLPKARRRMSSSSNGMIDMTKAQARAIEVDAMAKGAGDTLLSMVESHNKAVKVQQDNYAAELVQQGSALMAQSNGDISAVPAHLRSELVRLGKWDDVAKYSGVTDTSTLYKLRDLPNEQFATVDLRQYAPALSREDLLHEQERQKKIQSGDEGFKTFQATANNFYTKVAGTKKNDAQKASFEIRAEREYDKFVAENKRPPNKNESRDILQAITLKEDSWGSSRFVFEAQPAEQIDVAGVRVDDIPFVSRVIDRAGFEVTKDNIESFVKNPSFFVGKVPSVPDEQVNTIALRLIESRIAVTPANISTVYKRSLENKASSGAAVNVPDRQAANTLGAEATGMTMGKFNTNFRP